MLDLSHFTAERRQAITAHDGPLMVVAGPGCGKTTILAARIAYLSLVRGVNPCSILAITFTRLAGSHLRTRLAGVLGPQAKDVDILTFHALGLRIVRRWARELGFVHDQPMVWGSEEARQAIVWLAEQQGFNLTGESVDELLGELDRIRCDANPPAQRLAIGRLAQSYERLLLRRNAVDFTGMLTLPLRLFRARPDALQLCQDMYRQVLVDEFQDVAPIQYTLLHALVEPHGNLVVVGDPAQTIFQWRGAQATVWQSFAQDFPQASVVHLNDSFRSTAHIVEAINAIGQTVPDQHPLETANHAGDKLVFYAADDEQDEAAFVAGEVRRLISTGYVERPADIAVLYRTSEQAHSVAMAFRRQGIAYRAGRGGDLLSRREVRDAIAYLRLVDNPEDGFALARVVDTPPHGLADLVAVLRAEPVGLSALPCLAEPLGPASLASAEQLVGAITHLHERRQRFRPAEALDAILETSDYPAWLAQRPDADGRLESLVALRTLLQKTETDLSSWLASVQAGEAMELVPEDGRVHLMTIHAAKGSEWPVVFIAGAEDGLLPHARALEAVATDPEALTDELRVMYVAISRARARLYLSACRRRQRAGQIDLRQPSRFLAQLPARALTRLG